MKINVEFLFDLLNYDEYELLSICDIILELYNKKTGENLIITEEEDV